MIHKIIICICLICVLPYSSAAQPKEQTGKDKSPDLNASWYLGIQGGVPFAVSTFSSFGADKTHAGITAGLYGGYRFNAVLSLEAQAVWGKAMLSARDCCTGYWLGSNGTRYEAAVGGMNGHNYTELESRTALQRYGVQLNINLLGFFPKMKDSRWSVELSPLIAATGTKATIRSLAADRDVQKGSTRWHIGAGGNLQAGYHITKHLSATLYSGITSLTGKRMDGMPKHLHKNNFIWESGLKLGYTFGKRGKTDRAGESATPAAFPETSHGQPETQPATDSTATPQPSPVKTEIAATETQEDTAVIFPTVYFPFNSTRIADAETSKLQEMLRLLNTHPGLTVIITGWCDTTGSKAVNARISLQRAEAVKAWLMQHGIDANRIRTAGKGSDYNAADAAKARRADTDKNGKENKQ